MNMTSAFKANLIPEIFLFSHHFNMWWSFWFKESSAQSHVEEPLAITAIIYCDRLIWLDWEIANRTVKYTSGGKWGVSSDNWYIGQKTIVRRPTTIESVINKQACNLVGIKEKGGNWNVFPRYVSVRTCRHLTRLFILAVQTHTFNCPRSFLASDLTWAVSLILCVPCFPASWTEQLLDLLGF